MSGMPLDGLKIADFSWVATGPAAVRYLADHGATVVRVESSLAPDTLRLGHPFKDGIAGLDRAGYFTNYNAGKYSLAVNVKTPLGVQVARRLCMWADVVVESYTPRVMRQWGLDYESLAKTRPDLIMASTCQQGQTGPYALYRGYGPQGASLAGFYHLTGWPDGEPTGPYGAYTDLMSFRFLVVAILAAVEHRQRTGKGQYIDQAQVEAGINFLVPAMLEYAANGRVPSRAGNADPAAAPHGAYRCKGEERWCAIAVTSDGEWRAFQRVLGNPPWATEPRFATLLGRKQNEQELDLLVDSWTQQYTAEQVMAMLQAAGVPAGVVQNARDLQEDPQLLHRQHYRMLPHKVIGPHTYDSPAFRLSETPGEVRAPGPLLGEHSEYVLRDLLGFSDEEIVSLVAAGVLE